jgi:hypothetical protein
MATTPITEAPLEPGVPKPRLPKRIRRERQYQPVTTQVDRLLPWTRLAHGDIVWVPLVVGVGAPPVCVPESGLVYPHAMAIARGEHHQGARLRTAPSIAVRAAPDS